MIIYKNYFDRHVEKKVRDNYSCEHRSTNTLRHHVQRYGVGYPYSNYHVGVTIPDIFLDMINKIRIDNPSFKCNSVTINEYKKGDSIEWHTDSIDSGENIAVVSFLSDCELLFRKYDTKKIFDVPRYSLYIMSGELRKEWQHSISPLKDDHRISVVFRNCKQMF